MIEINRKNESDDLTCYRCDCRSADSELENENKHGVKNDVRYCADSLSNHCVEGPSRGLQKSFVHYLKENSEAGSAAYSEIFFTLVDDIRNIGLRAYEKP